MNKPGSRLQDISFTGLISPASLSLKTLRIVGFDTEDDTRGRPFSFAFHDGVTPFYTTSQDEAIDYIYNTKAQTCFVAHNLEYDIGNLFKHHVPKKDFRYVKEMVFASKLLRVDIIGRSHFFLNSSSFFQGPLSKMGELVGIPKLDGDPLNPAYNIRDALIPQVFLSRMQERCHALSINLGMTVGQIAMAAFRGNFLRGPFGTFNHPDVLKAYYGGRVELFHKGVVRGPVYVADINSSYPDVMRNNPFPDAGAVEPSLFCTHRFGVGHFKIHVPSHLHIPPLPYRSLSGKLFFPVGDVDGDFAYAEVQRALEMGCSILSEEKGFGTNSAVYPFREFVDHFWNERMPLKDKTDPDSVFLSLFYKLLMNNLYGKFSQWKPSQKLLRVRMTRRQMEEEGIPLDKEHKLGPFFSYTIPRKKAPKTANYLWGVYITAYARLSLLSKLLAVHESGGKVLYCDTDSIIFTEEGGKTALDFGKGLGQMSLETFDLGVLRTSKGYLLCDKARANTVLSKGRLYHGGRFIGTGVPRKWLPFLKQSLQREFEIKKVACKGVPTDYALPFIRDGFSGNFRKPIRLKEGLIRVHAGLNAHKQRSVLERMSVNYWRDDVSKKMNGIYVKRSIGAGGETSPLDVADIPEAESRFRQIDSPLPGMDEVVIRQKKRVDVFSNIKIPKGWFRRHGSFKEDQEYFESQKIHFFAARELEGLGKGEAWFSGKCLRKEHAKYGDYYVVFVKKILGSDARRKKFLGGISTKFFEGVAEEKIIGKQLEIFLEANYVRNSEPILGARIG